MTEKTIIAPPAARGLLEIREKKRQKQAVTTPPASREKKEMMQISRNVPESKGEDFFPVGDIPRYKAKQQIDRKHHNTQYY